MKDIEPTVVVEVANCCAHAALLEAEKQTRQIIQVGMQRCSYGLDQQGREIVAAGTLGNVRMVRSCWLNNYLGGNPASAKLDGPIDWEQWQEPLDKRTSFNPGIFRNWRNYSTN